MINGLNTFTSKVQIRHPVGVELILQAAPTSSWSSGFPHKVVRTITGQPDIRIHVYEKARYH